MLCWYIECSKTKNEVDRGDLEVKNQDATYGPQISSLTCNNVPVMSLENEISQVRYGKFIERF